MFALLSLAFFSFAAPSLAQSSVVGPADYPTRIPGQCANTGQFDCGNGSCIPVAFVRNCVVNCPDGSDEECGVGQVLCDSNLPVPGGNGCGVCVNNVSTALVSCKDRQYAGVCQQSDVFHCLCTMNCINPTWVLDGTDDCGDGSDENPCIANRTNGCPANAECVFDPISLNHTCECRSGYVPFASLCFPPLGVTIATTTGVPLSRSCDFHTLPTVNLPTTTTSVTTSTKTSITTTSTVSLTPKTTTIATTSTAISSSAPATTTTLAPAISSTTSAQTIATTKTTQLATTTAPLTTTTSAASASSSTAPSRQNCSGNYQCVNGNCINDSLVLNGIDNCGDGSDEDVCTTLLKNCTAPPSTGQCAYRPSSHSFACGCPALTEPNANSFCAPISGLPFDCGDVLKMNVDKPSGTTVTYDTCVEPMQCERYLLCDEDTDGGGWTTIQHRNSTGNFARTWQEYKDGFGNATEDDFWLGNELIHRLTSTRAYELLVVMKIPLSSNGRMIVKYDSFIVGDETSGYQLTIGAVKLFIGTNANDLMKSNGGQFSAIDRGPSLICAQVYRSGWWFDAICSGGGNLNVPIAGDPSNPNLVGITWGGQDVSGVAMLIREKGFPIPPQKEESVLGSLGVSVHSTRILLVDLFVIVGICFHQGTHFYIL